MENQNKSNLRIVKLKEVVCRVGYSRATIYRLVASGEFPKQIQLGARAVGWLESDIDGWILSKIEINN